MTEIVLKGGRTGRVEFISACRRMAIEDGTTLEQALWEALKGVMRKAAEDGDAKSLDIVLKWVARFDPEGAETKAGAAVEITNNTLALGTGPQLPERLDDYYERLAKIEEERGVQRAVDDILS